MNYRLASCLILAAFRAAAVEAAAQEAPAVGQRYVVDGRCVTLTQASRSKVSYEWHEGNASGSGYGPPSLLGERCDLGGGTRPAAPLSARPSPSRPPSARPPAGNAAPQPDSGRAAPTLPAAAAPTGEFAREALLAHNRFRCMHGVPAVQWSTEVAAYAQRWVDSHPFGHSDTNSAPLARLGENIASGYDTLTDAVADWYAESKGFNYKRAGYRQGSGHFTAMIWKGVRYIGCGRKGDFISCNYYAGPDPASCAAPNFNMDRCSVSQVLPPTRSDQDCR